jgi:hypothetical protein
MKRHFSIDEQIFINQYSQNIYSLEKMEEWFNDRDYNDKKDVILNLLNMVIQVHATYEEILYIAESLGLLSSTSAIKLLNKNKPYSKYGYELADLPEKELNKCFKLLISVFALADNRRKNKECISGCRHWWHQDLSDKSFLEKLKNRVIE